MASSDVSTRPPGGGPGAPRPRRWVRVGIAVLTVVAGLGLIAAVPWLRHAFVLCLHGDVAGLRSYVQGLGAGGVVLLVCLMVVHALIYYPTELVTAAAGYVYGWRWGLVIALGGWLLSAVASYGLGRWLAGPLLRSLLGRRFADFEAAVERGGIELLLAYRLIPVVPFSLMGYAAGATGISLWTFAWTSVVGLLPETAAVVYLGARARALSLTDPVLWGAVVVLLGGLIGGHLWSRRRTADSDAAA